MIDESLSPKFVKELKKRGITPVAYDSRVTNGRVGNCTLCGDPAGVNTPHIRPTGELVCNHCADVSDEFLVGVGQFYGPDGKFIFLTDFRHFAKRGAVLSIYINTHKRTGERIYDVSAWITGGSHSWPLTNVEEELAFKDPEKLLDGIADTEASGNFRCTDCEEIFPHGAIAGYPLFSGRVCADCMEKHRKKLEQEIRDGHVCRMCGQPYSNCCC